LPRLPALSHSSLSVVKTPASAPATPAPRNFFADVHEVARLIPPGRVSSYGAIAHYLGSRRGARMVGWAMMAAHTADEYVPAHRVLNRLGQLTGRLHYATPTAMQEALEKEGVRVVDDQVVNLASIFWDPSTEL
jgi:methylated-DNA-protein-cysteine methyltransferase-like protein